MTEKEIHAIGTDFNGLRLVVSDLGGVNTSSDELVTKFYMTDGDGTNLIQDAITAQLNSGPNPQILATNIFATGVQITASAVTATADGLTTGIIPDYASFVTVTSANSGHFVTLPTPGEGYSVCINVGANGYKLRSSAPGTVAINGGVGASASSTVGANVYVECRCRDATKWIVNQYAADGTESKLTAAA